MRVITWPGDSMARYDGMVHAKLPPDGIIRTRDKGTPIRTEDTEQFSPEFVMAGLLELRETLQDMARQTENRSNPVDEYQTCPLSGSATESVLTLQPTYEF